MNTLSLQYIAGLIDGEGYISILPSRSKELRNPSFEPVIKIGMTGKSAKLIFEYLVNSYGGHIDFSERSHKNPKWKDVNTYIIKSKPKVLRLLNDIIPYLIIKKEQAAIVIEFCKLPYAHPKSPKFDIKTIERRVEIYDMLKYLKQL